METGPRFIVPSDGLEKPGIEPATPGLQGEWHNHCTTEAPQAKNMTQGIPSKILTNFNLTSGPLFNSTATFFFCYASAFILYSDLVFG